MKVSLYILTYLFLLTSCFGQTKTNNTKEKNTYANREIDTLIERNNPNALDLTRHQLFIDTSRTYEFYAKTEKWNPFEGIKEITIDYINYLYPNQTVDTFDFQDFPKLWILLRKFEGEYILYDRCDGAETSYGLSNSIFYIFGVHELQDVRKIKRIIKLNKNELEIEQYTNEKYENTVIVNIQKTEKEYVYKLSINVNDLVSTVYVTPNKDVRNFDVLVNHCPINKVVEFDTKLDN